MSSNDKFDLTGFLEDALSPERRAHFESLPSAIYVPGTAQERLELLFELNELLFALAGDKLDLRYVMPGNNFVL